MSQRQSKKFRKEVRKVVDANFGVGMKALANIVRPKPSYVPKWVWIVVYVPLFPWKYLHLIYKHMK